jgi:membrane protein
MLYRFGEFVTGQGALVGRLLKRLAEIGGVQRATILGAQAFTSLIPYLVIASALVPTARNESFADTLIENFDLEEGAADGVRALFASAGEVESAITFLGIGILLVSITSFARSLQSTYERAYGLEPDGLAGLPRGLLWIGALAIWLSLSSIRAEMQDWAGPVFSATVALSFAFALWLLTPMILLGRRRVETRLLVPGAVVSAVLMTALLWASAIYMPILIENAALRYGLIGIAFSLQGWLLAISLVIVAGAVVGSVLSEDMAARERTRQT